MDTNLKHISVLRDEVVSYLAPDANQQDPYLIYDATLGAGGHSQALLESSKSIVVLGVDRDPYALKRAGERLKEYSERMYLSSGVFSAIGEHLSKIPSSLLKERRLDNSLCDAMLLDLGVSSFQLDDSNRGFSFRSSAPLDMRMDSSQELSAANVVNDYDFVALKKVLLAGGVGASSAALAKAIVASRPISTTIELGDICSKVLRTKGKEKKRHPATVVFQAIRVEVNDEFGEIKRFLSQVPSYLAPGGTLAVISFHSTEDKLVTSQMRSWSRPSRPLKELAQADRPALGELLTSSPVIPSEAEIENNPRSRSARLRVFRRNQDLN